MRFHLVEMHGDWFLLGREEGVIGGEWRGQVMIDPSYLDGGIPNADIIDAAKERLREMRLACST